MYKILKQILFISNVIFIFIFEVSKFTVFKDYYNFIENLTQKLANINILYVKVFQAIALNNSLINNKMNNKLLKFTDNAPWNNSDIRLMELIQLTNDNNINLIDGYETPINSGMISLVYRGFKKDNGQKVIIKMKRNNIEEKLNDAIENLQMFMYLLSFIPIIKKYQIAEVVNKNIDIIIHQTNFSQEIDNIIKMKNNCGKLKYVKIPEVYQEITEKYPDFIVMEFIEGIKINEIQKEDYENFAKQVLKFGFVTTIIHGVTHGDLHGGNLLFIKDEDDKKHKYKIGVIDFGIIYELDEEYRNFTFELLTKMFETSPRESAIKLFNSCLLDPPGIFEQIPKKHQENIIEFTSQIIEETINTSKKANQLQIYNFLYKFRDYLNNSEISNIGIRPSSNFIKTQLVLAMAHGVTLTLCKEDYISIADKVINELFHIDMIN
jgi:predicted unusual protein kinase regulating ubiquinone biosynthesis (AarF/ABC1/UbiB family)